MISISLWRAEIGNFYNCSHTFKNQRKLNFSFKDFSSITFFFYSLLLIFSDVLNHKFDAILLLVEYGLSKILSLIFCNKVSKSNYRDTFKKVLFLFHLLQGHLTLLLLLLCSGDIEINPGPELFKNISLCHWNLNSISVYSFIKKDLLVAFNSIHNFDLICISETYLDSSYSLDDQNFALTIIL